MNASTFDDLTQACAVASRRRALKLAVAALVGGLAAGAAGRGGTLVAQEEGAVGTPVAVAPAGEAPVEEAPPAEEPVAEAPPEAPPEPGVCTRFVLAGGPAPGDPIHVDDDLTVLLNGAPILADGDGGTNILPPFPFQAQAGDQLTIAARDVTACGRKIGALWLHCADGGEPRFLTGGQDDGCDEDRRVPDVFYRESWHI